MLVNNAGGSPPADSATASAKFSTAIIGLNLVAPLLCSQAAFARMREQQEGGAIVNIASVSGIRPSPNSAASRRGRRAGSWNQTGRRSRLAPAHS